MENGKRTAAENAAISERMKKYWASPAGRRQKKAMAKRRNPRRARAVKTYRRVPRRVLRNGAAGAAGIAGQFTEGLTALVGHVVEEKLMEMFGRMVTRRGHGT